MLSQNGSLLYDVVQVSQHGVTLQLHIKVGSTNCPLAALSYVAMLRYIYVGEPCFARVNGATMEQKVYEMIEAANR
jgi:hypothetical protein